MLGVLGKTLTPKQHSAVVDEFQGRGTNSTQVLTVVPL
jgi:hypothetical protein